MRANYVYCRWRIWFDNSLREFNCASNCEFTAIENLNCNASPACVNDSVCERNSEFPARCAESACPQKHVGYGCDPSLR